MTTPRTSPRDGLDEAEDPYTDEQGATGDAKGRRMSDEMEPMEGEYCGA